MVHWRCIEWCHLGWRHGNWISILSCKFSKWTRTIELNAFKCNLKELKTENILSVRGSRSFGMRMPISSLPWSYESGISCVKSYLRAVCLCPRRSFSHFLRSFIFFGVLVEALQTDDLLSGEPFLRTPRYPGLSPQLDFFVYLKSTHKLSKMRRTTRLFWG